jgi:hypothetical protein
MLKCKTLPLAQNIEATNTNNTNVPEFSKLEEIIFATPASE